MRRVLTVLVALLWIPAGASAQQTDTVPVDTARGPSPAGAMLRSMILPGWGQLATGAEVRAAVYFGGHAANTFMVVTTQRRIDRAEERARLRTREAEDSIRAQALEDEELAERIENPDTLAALVQRDARVRHARGLADTRRQQREDWLAWTIFWMLASGVDAYVNAHLQDFPGRLSVHPRVGGGVDLGVRVPAGQRW